MTTVTRSPRQDAPASQSPEAPRRRAAWPIVMRREILVKITDKGFVLGTLPGGALVAVGVLLGSRLGRRR